MIYSKLPIVFLGLLASEKKESTNSIIASYILDNIEKMQTIGIKNFADSCNVSISSISRFCREIGLENFSELKLILMQADLSKGTEAINGTFKERINTYAKKTVTGISKIISSINENDMNELIADIYAFNKVAIFGLMKAETSALILQSDLLMYGKRAYTNLSYKEQRDYILNANKDDLIIIFSFTNSYFDYLSLKSSFIKKKNPPKIWTISGGVNSPATFVHKCLRFNSDYNHFEHPSQLNFLATVIAQEYKKHITDLDYKI